MHIPHNATELATSTNQHERSHTANSRSHDFLSLLGLVVTVERGPVNSAVAVRVKRHEQQAVIPSDSPYIGARDDEHDHGLCPIENRSRRGAKRPRVVCGWHFRPIGI